eukprot:TRINITY_DN18719_c0_g1_i1.p2 TRINITY_DN18719_c0_g1~~TRINITY_DN18719_c0_g1_i1.p2  ORF type:complete len:270 (-),score=45.33 TRINITY_DN18719_c0_g1_i1:97-906(-)
MGGSELSRGGSLAASQRSLHSTGSQAAAPKAKPKPPHLQGTELLPAYHKYLSSDTRQFAFFTTSGRDATPNHWQAHRSHSTRAMRDKVFFKNSGANLQGLRSSTQLPLYKAQFCEHNREYVSKSLDNAPADRQLADIWLKAGRSGGETVPGTKLGSDTTHKQCFKWHNEDPRMPNCKPAHPVHVEIGSKSLEKEAVSRSQFSKERAHPSQMAGNLRGELMPLRGECAWTGLPQVPNDSQYGLDFRESIYKDFKRKSAHPKTFNPSKPPE